MAVGIRTEALLADLHPGVLGRRFLLHRSPVSEPVRALVVYVHPFAEEMNKSRRMATLQSIALAKSGWAVLQIDLLGCGDSGGDFGDATWNHWVDDVVQAAHWLMSRHVAAGAPLWLWGLRAGCLLAGHAAERLARPVNYLFWQPTPSGQVILQQFLRLKLAGDMIGSHGKGAMTAMRQALASGQAVDVAGYRLSPELAQGLAEATLKPTPMPSRVEWLELSSRAQPALSPTSSMAVDRWRAAGHAVRPAAVTGPAFWQTTEIEWSSALLEESTARLNATAVETEAHAGQT
jgi:exosortase A-associated hydrolase 2